MYNTTTSFNSADKKRSISGSRSRVSNKFLDILKRYRELYQKAWCDKSTATKYKALDNAIIEKSTEIYTRDVFYQEFARRVDVLLDSKHFCDAVKGLIPPLDPYNVATHIVVLGDKELKRILLEGGYKNLNPFPEWKEPILKKDDLNSYLENRDEKAQSQKPAEETKQESESVKATETA